MSSWNFTWVIRRRYKNVWKTALILISKTHSKLIEDILICKIWRPFYTRCFDHRGFFYLLSCLVTVMVLATVLYLILSPYQCWFQWLISCRMLLHKGVIGKNLRLSLRLLVLRFGFFLTSKAHDIKSSHVKISLLPCIQNSYTIISQS